jgi:hypothetical protein
MQFFSKCIHELTTSITNIELCILNLNFNGENFMKIGPEITLVEFLGKRELFI